VRRLRQERKGEDAGGGGRALTERFAAVPFDHVVVRDPRRAEPARGPGAARPIAGHDEVAGQDEAEPHFHRHTVDLRERRLRQAMETQDDVAQRPHLLDHRLSAAADQAVP
jgi:hypothetical protein